LALLGNPSCGHTPGLLVGLSPGITQRSLRIRELPLRGFKSAIFLLALRPNCVFLSPFSPQLLTRWISPGRMCNIFYPPGLRPFKGSTRQALFHEPGPFVSLSRCRYMICGVFYLESVRIGEVSKIGPVGIGARSVGALSLPLQAGEHREG